MRAERTDPTASTPIARLCDHSLAPVPAAEGSVVLDPAVENGSERLHCSAWEPGTPEHVVQEGRAAGLSYLVITDHDTDAGRSVQGYRDGVLVLVGTDLPWILSNPIYVYDADEAAARVERAAWPAEPPPPPMASTLNTFADGSPFAAENDLAGAARCLLIGDAPPPVWAEHDEQVLSGALATSGTSALAGRSTSFVVLYGHRRSPAEC